METPDFEHGRVYFKQFGTERVNGFKKSSDAEASGEDASLCGKGVEVSYMLTL